MAPERRAWVRILGGEGAAEILFSFRPRNRRGRREGRVPTAPMVRVQQKARGRTTGTGGSSGLPLAMVLRLIRDLPVCHALLPPSPPRPLPQASPLLPTPTPPRFLPPH